MRRDLGNEIVVAIAAVGVIVAAVVFGILLTLPNNRMSIVDATLIANLNTVTTPSPTRTTNVTSSPTDSPTPRTLTSAATYTATVQLDITEAFTRAVSATPPMATATKVTLKATNTRTPSATHTASATKTPRATQTASPSMTRTPTRTALATPTATADASATHTPTFEVFPNVTPLSLCAIPQGWQIYIVKSGDTLSKIAHQVGSTVEALSAANCLVDVNRIVTGDVLYVPSLGMSIGTPIGVSTDVALAYYGCAFPEVATITNLAPGQVIRGTFTLEGTANLPSKFWFYRLEIRPDFSNAFVELGRVYKPVIMGILGVLDTTTYAPGLYWVRLVVVDSDWRYPPSNACMIPVYFQPMLP